MKTVSSWVKAFLVIVGIDALIYITYIIVNGL